MTPYDSELSIGAKVSKISGKPFKSRRKVNTIKAVITHPQTQLPAFTFHEDDSVVDARTCKLATAAELALTEKHYGAD